MHACAVALYIVDIITSPTLKFAKVQALNHLNSGEKTFVLSSQKSVQTQKDSVAGSLRTGTPAKWN